MALVGVGECLLASSQLLPFELCIFSRLRFANDESLQASLMWIRCVSKVIWRHWVDFLLRVLLCVDVWTCDLLQVSACLSVDTSHSFGGSHPRNVPCFSLHFTECWRECCLIYARRCKALRPEASGRGDPEHPQWRRSTSSQGSVPWR